MQVTGESLALIMIWTAVIGVLWIPIAWLLLSIFTPKSVLNRYFKEPHFSLAETVLMAQFPGFLIRTTIFGWVILIPSLDKKRKIKGVANIMPRWYSIALKLFIVLTMITLAIFLGIMSFLLIFQPE